MSRAKGSEAERELVHRFWAVPGWSAHRVAGSGSSTYPSPDIIAGSAERKLGIECKASSKAVQYLSAEQLGQLCTFCERFGAEPWLALRFPRADWLFVRPNALDWSGSAWAISRAKAAEVGLDFSGLLRQRPAPFSARYQKQLRRECKPQASQVSSRRC